MKQRNRRPRPGRRPSSGRGQILVAQAARLLGIHRRTFERRYLYPPCDRTRAKYARQFRVGKDAHGNVTVSRARVEQWRDARANPRRGTLDRAPFAARHAAHRPLRTWAAALAPVMPAADTRRPTGAADAPARSRARTPRTPSPQLPLAL